MGNHLLARFATGCRLGDKKLKSALAAAGICLGMTRLNRNIET
jgi:hypothetical protein